MTNVPISSLNPGTTVKDSDLFPDVQEVGVGPVKVTGSQIKLYVSESPSFVTPNIGVAHGTSLALGGAAIGTNALAVTGTADFNSAVTLGTQQLIQGQLVLSNTSAGAYSTTLKSSNLSTSGWVFTLPPDSGTNGYILTTNGSGTSAWTDPTALGIDIDVNSTAITGGTSGHLVYDNSGKFGEMSAITTDGAAALTLGTQQTTQGTIVLANTAAGVFPVTIKSSNSTSASWSLTLPTTAGTNKYALITDGSGVSSWSQIDLGAAVTGTLPVNHGGTGQTSLAAHGVVIGNSTSGVNVTATGSSGQIFQSGGASADPVWSTATFPSTATSAGTILRADGTNWVATTATYPATTTINQILYSNANNQVTGLTTANGGVVNTNSSGVPSITTNPTLGVQQTTQGSIVLANTAAGAFPTTLKSSNSATEAWTLTLPISKGTNGYILTTDGTGVSSWTNPTSLGIDIDVNTTAITGGTSGRIVYDNSGTFGEISAITTNGSNTLTIGTQQSSQGSLVLSNTAVGAFATTIQSSNSASASWTLTLPTTAGTNNYVLTTNGSGTSSWSQVSLTAGVTGVLPVANGGTGQSTNTVHGVLIGNSNNAINATTAGSSGQLLQSGGASADPTWTTATFPSTATSTGTILRADGTNWGATTTTYPATTTAGTILVSATANEITGSSNPVLGVQQTTQGSLVLANTAAGAFSTTLKSSNSATEAWTLTLPVSKGTNGYILTTDGTGVSSWTNPTALGIDIDINSTAITSGTSGRLLFDNAATVGETSAITTNGSGTLTIGTQQTTQGSIVFGNTAAGAFATTVQSSNSASAAWTLTLPTTAGTNNYWLKTDGSGNTSWTNSIAIATGTSLALGGATIGTDALAITGTSTMGSATYFPDGAAATPSIAHSGDANCGIYFPSADTIAFSTAGTQALNITSSQTIGIGVTPGSGQTFKVGKNITGSTSSSAITTECNILSDVTNYAQGFVSSLATSAASFTLNNLIHYRTYQGTIGLGSAVTNQYGFYVDSSLTGATNNFGFYGNIASGSGRWNFYAAGTADNYFSGKVGIGVAPAVKLDIVDSGNQLRMSAGVANSYYGFDCQAGYSTWKDFSDGSESIQLSNSGFIYFSTASANRFILDGNGNAIVNTGAIATNATNGFLYVAGCAGTPTGTPTAYTGRVPIVVDTTNNKLYFYSGGAWRDAGP